MLVPAVVTASTAAWMCAKPHWGSSVRLSAFTVGSVIAAIREELSGLQTTRCGVVALYGRYVGVVPVPGGNTDARSSWAAAPEAPPTTTSTAATDTARTRRTTRMVLPRL